MPETIQHAGKALANKRISLTEVRLTIDCEACGFVHFDPLPDPAELATYYTEQFYSDRWPQYLTKSQFEAPYWLAIYRERIAKIEELHGNLPENPYLLDVGSGPGLFLAANQRWVGHGIEPSEAAREHCRAQSIGCVYGGTFQDFNLNCKYDAIHMSFLLEHMPDPAAVLRKCHRYLNDGGLLCIEVPNDGSPTQAVAERVTDKREWWLSWPDHLAYFTPKSLRALVERCGFEVAYETGTFDMNLALIAGIDYVGNDALGKMVHHFRMELEKNLLRHDPALKEKLYQAMYGAGVSRELVFFARKEVA